MHENMGTKAQGIEVSKDPALHAIHKHLTDRLQAAHEHATRIENAVDRLSGPTPKPAVETQSNGAIEPSLEYKLNANVSEAWSLADRLHELASRLERAV